MSSGLRSIDGHKGYGIIKVPQFLLKMGGKGIEVKERVRLETTVILEEG